MLQKLFSLHFTMESYVRTVDDAQEAIKQAKVDIHNVYATSQAIYYPSQQKCDEVKSEFRLMDLDEEFISMLEAGDSFVFRGEKDEKLVLCTDKKTYEVKEGEMSNTMLLSPDLLYLNGVKSLPDSPPVVLQKEIAGVFSRYLELRLTYPRLRKLRKLLAACKYRGPEHEEEDSNGGYYLCELLDQIQCSREELLAGLEEITACSINGRWRLLDLEYETRILSFIVSLVEEKSWKVIPKKECTAIFMQMVPKDIMEHFYKYFLRPIGDDHLHWQAERVYRSFAEMLLRAGEGKFRYNEFVMALNQCVPSSIKCDLTMYARGLAVLESEGEHKQVLHLFPEYELPESISERFRLLFQRKEKWTFEEIQPYIEKLTTKDFNINVLLTKFCRPSTLHGVRVFGGRYLK